MQPLVGVMMGSKSDWETMQHTAETLEKLAVPFEVRVVSAHRTPDLLFDYASTAESRGLQVIVAGAGGAAHLPGMVSAKTLLPVLGVPVESKALHGVDSLLSIVQMPAGVPVGTLAIGRAGAVNAALLAAAIVARTLPEVRAALARYRAQQTQTVLDHPDPRGSMKVGVLGGGQLGRMLALAGYPLGLRFRFLDPAPESPVEELADLVVGRFDDLDVLQRFPDGLDVVTYEFENVPVEAARHLVRRAPVYPPIQALEVCQDRLAEKTLFASLGLTPAPFAAVDQRDDLDRAVQTLGLPAVLKTRRLGYDGKGQHVLHRLGDVDLAWRRLGGVPLILEGFIAFDRELSQIGVRGRDGSVELYPLVENHHRDGILRRTLAPAPHTAPALQKQASEAIRLVLTELAYVGVLAIEFFQKGETLIANEMAPRVHNSGHWTIEGARTSQFENHLRAVLGWPLGAAEAVAHSAMVNLIGSLPEPPGVLAVPGTHLHVYGKKPRPGRKVGHATVWAETPEQVSERLERLRRVLGEIE